VTVPVDPIAIALDVEKGGQPSDRQWRDILGIIRVQDRQLDRAYVYANAPALSVADLLARALREGMEA